MQTTPRNDEDMTVVTAAKATHDRRSILRKLAAGGVAVAGCAALPRQWFPPVLEFATLPAHAATSGEVKKAESSPDSKFPESARAYGYKKSLTMDDRGEIMQCDSINQHKITFPKLGPEYGSSMLFIWSDNNELHVPNSSKMAMNGDQSDYRKYQPGGQYSGNNPDIPTMEVYAKRGTHPSSVTMYY